jgi:tRNA 2-selenouridine synthase
VETPLSYADLRGFDDVLDARSPEEYAEDHLPPRSTCRCSTTRSARSWARSTSSARRSRRSASAPRSRRATSPRTSSGLFADKPRNWRPLVYCWRGGGRSGSLVHVLRQVGWDARRLEGGYKAFRRQVVADLEALPARFSSSWCAARPARARAGLLEALGARGLPGAGPRGPRRPPRLGAGRLPGPPAVAEGVRDRALERALAVDPQRPVYVESESKKVGNLRVPERLIERMRASRCLRLEADTMPRRAAARGLFALRRQPAALQEKLDLLRDLHGAERTGSGRAPRAGAGIRSCATCSRATTTRRTGARSRATTARRNRHRRAVGDISPEGFERLARALAASTAETG